jgi:hypothetical protein
MDAFPHLYMLYLHAPYLLAWLKDRLRVVALVVWLKVTHLAPSRYKAGEAAPQVRVPSSHP